MSSAATKLSLRLYTLLIWLLLPGALLHLLWRARRQPEYLQHWGERFARYGDAPRNTQPCIWLHAVSVGETRATQPLIKQLRARWPQHRILLTHMTPTGRQTGIELYGDGAENGIDRVYLPYDTPAAMRRFLMHFQPQIGIIMETELWPNLIAACRAQQIPLLLVNARLSEKSARRYARFATVTRGALEGLSAIAAQTGDDAMRLTHLGARSIQITGNLKFDIEPPAAQFELGASLRALWESHGKRPLLLAASTREGEEELLLDALSARPIPQLLLVIVPRHPQRFNAVADLVRSRRLRLQRRSENSAVLPETQVLLGDSMGEMFAYYAACDLAFIGGSLLDYGSQNLIEACATGAPVLLGPSTFNFAEAAAAAQACGAARRVMNAADLVSQAAALLNDADKREQMSLAGRDFSIRHRGASERTLALIAQYIDRP